MTNSPTSKTLDELIASYLQAVERGQEPDQEQWLADHPEHAEGLGAFFVDNSRVDRQFAAAVIDLTTTTVDKQGLPTGSSPRIGNYKLFQQLGFGGMGEVWMAEQEKPIRRRVALKLIKPGMDSKVVLARFDAERQALALMSHPNIARVFDAGIIGPEDHSAGVGRPYFVMELVRGIPITEYCDARRLQIRERLQLYRQCCSAVHHAHQKGIIHRDLKPSNILVESHDDHPVLKVIDFGLAKAIGGTQLTEQTLFTALGTVAGTPLYMAPEQAVLNALDVDIRADIYSLGVLLYELLTGSTPLTSDSLKRKGLDELLKLIRDYEPPLPSQRLSDSDALASIAATRQIEPARLGRFVRGELDWIVMKALAKERERRYGSALAFSEDIDRFLNEEPVHAGPPSKVYQLRKFAQKYRGLVAAASFVFGTLLLGIAGTTLGFFVARNAQNEAVKAERIAVSSRDEAQKSSAKAEVEAHRANEALQRISETLNAKNFQLALGYLERDDIGNATKTLFTIPRSERTIAWHALRSRIDGSRSTFYLEQLQVQCLDIDGAGRRIATGHRDGHVVIMDATSGETVSSMVLESSVHHLRFSKEGTVLFCLLSTGKLVAWEWPLRTVRFQTTIETSDNLFSNYPSQRVLDVSVDGAIVYVLNIAVSAQTGVLINKFAEIANDIACICAIGRGICVVNKSGHILVFGPHGKVLEKFELEDGPADLLDSTTDGTSLYYRAKNSGNLSRFDLETKMVDIVWEKRPGVSLDFLCVSPTNESVAYSTSDGTIHIFELATDAEFRLKGHVNEFPFSKPIMLSWNPVTFDLISSSDFDGTVKVWTKDGSQHVNLGPVNGISTLSNVNAGTLAVGNATGSVYLFKLDGEPTFKEVEAHSGRVSVVTISSSGKYFASCSDDGSLKIWGSENQNLLWQTNVGPSLGALAFSRDGNRVAVGSWKAGDVYVYERKTGQLEASLNVGHGVKAVCFDEGTDSILVGGGYDELVEKWNIMSMTKEKVYSQLTAFPAFSLGVFEGQIVAACDDGSIVVFDYENGEYASTTKISRSRMYSFSLSPNRDLATTSGGDGILRFVDLRSAEEILQFPITGALSTVDWRNNRIISYSKKGLSLWDLRERVRTEFIYVGHQSMVQALSLNPTAPEVVSCAVDGELHHWDLRSGELLRKFRPPVGRPIKCWFSASGDEVYCESFVAQGQHTIWGWNLKDSTPIQREDVPREATAQILTRGGKRIVPQGRMIRVVAQD